MHEMTLPLFQSGYHSAAGLILLSANSNGYEKRSPEHEAIRLAEIPKPVLTVFFDAGCAV